MRQYGITHHFIQFLESKDSKIKYVSVDSELSDILVDDSKKSTVVDKENKTEDDKLIEIFKKQLNDDKLKIEVKSLKSESISGMVLESEYIKRMKTMNQFMKSTSAPAFEDLTLVINSNNHLVKNITKLSNTPGKETLLSQLCTHIFDIAKMSKQQLTGEQMQKFISRSNELMTQFSSQ